ncbi:DsbA family oxidoreductase [Alicyclobacillus sp. ALC3]|uniref:DsbA family oxidoreductase n=1 Tax=Alicyclobacillus sp. ALC3 TaxID=2796143 RepID=UPI0023791F5E|nr:DsbA family oxidoreductase [Alicyclobacillus sp. ALC3]WDL99058.1 DsbA family oxidoreductase [Alicyclobacillus sp. ALC3]
MKIDVFQDTVCPWCRIGKQHLFQALETWNGEPVEIHWRAFLLDPTTPAEGRPYSDLAKKFGGEERVAQMQDRICEAGEACGLDFAFGQVHNMPNTILSHQLILATPLELQTQMTDAVTAAHFEEGKDIGNLEVLLDIAVSLGLDRDEMREKVQSKAVRQAVERDLTFAQEAGISGVPLFIFNDKYAISGAQPVEVFVQALQQIHAEGTDA